MIFHFKDHLDLNITGKAYMKSGNMKTLLLTVCVAGWVPLGTFSDGESSTETCQPCPEVHLK